MKRAACTWGDGPDVLLDLKDDMFVLYEKPELGDLIAPYKGKYLHGYVTKGSMDLTADEALQLAAELTSAAQNAKEMDRMCEDHDKEHVILSDTIDKWGGSPLTEEDDEEVANQAKAFEIFKEIATEYDEYAHEELIDKMCEMNRRAMQKMPNVLKYVGDPLSEKDLMAILADHPLDTLTCYECPNRDTCKYVDDLYNTHGDCLATK